MWKRRQIIGSSAALAMAPAASAALSQTRRIGHLVIIGGAEDRQHDKAILSHFVQLCGGPGSRIRVICAASSQPLVAWATYQRAFGELGVSNCELVDIPDRDAANSHVVTDELLDADGIFISGGDQRRLMDLIWETETFKALHIAFHLRGSCVGGTSAGAAVMSRHMLASGEATRLPEKDVADLDIGLGFVGGAIVDQHFSERSRLGRLLSALAGRPHLLGVGIDEDTALVIERDTAIEVIGRGAVTIVDGRGMATNAGQIESRQRLEMLGVRLHLLPSGHRYSANSLAQRVKNLPAALNDAVNLLVAPGPIRG